MRLISFFKSVSLLSILLGVLSCGEPSPIVGKDIIPNEDRWRGDFNVNGKVIPFTFSLVEEKSNASGLRAFLYNGGQREQIEYVDVEGDSVHIPINSRKDLLSGKFNKERNQIEGNLMTGFGYSAKTPRAAFRAEKSNKPRFEAEDNATTIIPNGIWKLEFDTLKNLKTNNTDVLRLNIDRTGSIQLHRDGNILYGEIAAYGSGIQGFEGVMTKDGFICSSLHAAEPFLMEVKFEDENSFRGVITNSTDKYAFGGTKKSNTEVSADNSSSIFRSIVLLIKAYFDYV